MRLADETAIAIGSSAPIQLRPTLRAATRLERRYGFERIVQAISEGHIGVMADVISESAGQSARSHFLNLLSEASLSAILAEAVKPMTAHVLALAGHDDTQRASAQSGERISFAEFFAKLFRIGTGWLGWPPETTWNATPAEILEAYTGHVEMLRAIHGSPEREPSAHNAPDDSPLDRHGLRALQRRGGAA